MDKKTVLAFGLIIVVILLIPYYYKMVLPTQEPVVPPEGQDIFTVQDSAQVTIPQEKPKELPVTREMGAPELTRRTSGFTEETSPEFVTIETPLYQLIFTTRGALVTGCRLLTYKGQDDGYVQLVRTESKDNLNLVLYHKGNVIEMRDAHFVPDKKELYIPEDGQGRLTFRAENPDGGWVQKTFLFRGDEYPFQMRVEAGGIADLDPYYDVHWGGGLNITETDTTQDIYYAKAYASMGGEIEIGSGKGDKDLTGQASGRTDWVAQRNKYFEIAILPVSSPAKGVLFGMTAQPSLGKHRPKVYRMALNMGGQLDREAGVFSVYLGPLDQKTLLKIHPRLVDTMSWGWKVIEPFSKLVLWSLKSLHKLIPNYGLVLIIFSILVKIVVWPLTHKSTRAMTRMSALQPKMKELQEKYKGTPEKLNKAMMQLYKEEGVNPFSSCWPTLLQMPLLYALFIIFRSTIELRREPFILWITDLALPDVIVHLPLSIPMYGSHIALLPIFMGATQILMSKVMITDPKQKSMMYMMPVFMVLIFNNFPSGLTLYYTLFNLWTYLQHIYLKRQGAIPSAAKPGKPK